MRHLVRSRGRATSRPTRLECQHAWLAFSPAWAEAGQLLDGTENSSYYYVHGRRKVR